MLFFSPSRLWWTPRLTTLLPAMPWRPCSSTKASLTQMSSTRLFEELYFFLFTKSLYPRFAKPWKRLVLRSSLVLASVRLLHLDLQRLVLVPEDEFCFFSYWSLSTLSPGSKTSLWVRRLGLHCWGCWKHGGSGRSHPQVIKHQIIHLQPHNILDFLHH